MEIGSEVGWKWGNGLATGVVEEVHFERAEIESKSKIIVRNGTASDPAVVIRSSNGSLVVKLAHEIQKLK